MSTTRFPSGLTNAPAGSTLGMMGQPDPCAFHSLFDDFDRYLASNWTITLVGTGTTALAAGDGGLLAATTTALANDANFYQNTVASYLMEAGKRAFFKARFKVNVISTADIQLGLIVADTTPLDATDGIYFMKAAGSANLDVYVRKDATTGSNSATAVATLTDDTYVTLGWYYDGKSEVAFFVNDVKVKSLDASSTYLPDAALALSFGVRTSTTAARVMTVDYVFAAKER